MQKALHSSDDYKILQYIQKYYLELACIIHPERNHCVKCGPMVV